MANLISILVILSEVVIALISVTTAIYAIGLPFLRRRMRGFLIESRAKRQQLKEDLAKSLHDEAFVERMKSQIETHEQEEKRMYDQMGFLSKRRTIVYPCIFFGLSLFFSCFFMYMSSENVQYINLFSRQIPIDLIYLLIPTIFLLGGVYYIVRIFGVVETMALAPEAIPRITIVDFPKVVRMDEEEEIIIKLRNVGGDIARNISAFFYFPAGFEILKSSGRSYVSVYTRPGLHVAALNRDRVDVRVTVNLGKVIVRTPPKSGKYSVFVTLREEKLKYDERSLEIEVREGAAN